MFPVVRTSETLGHANDIRKVYKCDSVPVVGPDGGFEGFITAHFNGGLYKAVSTVMQNMA